MSAPSLPGRLAARLHEVVEASRGLLGIIALGAAYLAFGISAVQFFIANNVARRMDVVLSGGGVSLGLLLLAAAVLLAERQWLLTQREAEADRALAAELRAARSDGQRERATIGRPSHVLASTASYHRDDCFLVADHAGLRRITLRTAERGRLSRCRHCLGDLVGDRA